MQSVNFVLKVEKSHISLWLHLSIKCLKDKSPLQAESCFSVLCFEILGVGGS